MTIYFPLIVQGAMLIEPTESVGRQELDQFIEAMRSIAREAWKIRNWSECAARTRIGRLDEATAARKPVLRWKPGHRPHGQTRPLKPFFVNSAAELSQPTVPPHVR